MLKSKGIVDSTVSSFYGRGGIGISMRNKENIELPSRPIDTKAVGEQAIIF